jgi:hypothetical protein
VKAIAKIGEKAPILRDQSRARRRGRSGDGCAPC